MKTLTILDGGMGRELQEIGAPFSQPLWSAQALIESPEHVHQAHQNFIDAGSEIIITNSYACVPFHLGDARYQADGFNLARDAAKIARSVVNKTPTQAVLVAGAIPPPLGSYRPDLFEHDQAVDIMTTLMEAQAPYVDIWIAETISSIEELEAAVSVLTASDKDTYYALSLEDEDTQHARLRSGQPVKQAIEMACSTNAKGVMFNCSVPEAMDQAIEDTIAVINQLNADLIVGVYANNFKPIVSGHEANGTLQSMRELSPDDYLQYAKHWQKLGASIIGGCCGISPAHIQALSVWKTNTAG
ncbi:homocysteine S-methyltransferase family protein [Vibrio tapetis subsp. quintayensis]|uniref:homocysteine S-methyltransferase family protein n=1 Tax=Vibrio tapetis TaxID=52443 RepID=UPI0025B5B92B|nr:homocysteine S-methyltransferase family protein [Vibrio tapetis]MDN3682059.1 homocysteine S-methyltransferase family protein [Vibrio tapetis subsp. quintayensis]